MKAEEASAAKARSLANMSHEPRTLLSAPRQAPTPAVEATPLREAS